MGKISKRVSRRGFIKGGSVVSASLIAGCSGDGASNGGDGGSDGSGSGDSQSDDSNGDEASFPQEDFELIIPYSTGGGYDAYTRLTAKHMTDYTDVDVRVKNVTGAGGQIAAEQVHNADPDGYTAMIWNTMGFARREILEDVNYASAEMTYYGQIAEDTQGLAVRPDIGIETFDDFVEAINNEELTIGTQGMLNDGVLNALLPGMIGGHYDIEKILGNVVVYDGTSDIVNAMIAGDVDTVGANYYSLMPFQESGDIRILLALRTFDEVPLADQAPYAETLTTADLPKAEKIEAMTTNSRVFAGPPDVPDDRASTLADLFEQTITSDALQSEADEIDRPIAFAGREETSEAVTNAYELWSENEDLLNRLAGN